MSLTPDQVHQIRTSGYTDSFWADKLRVDRRTILAARRGNTYRAHPTPPDIAPRDSTGCTQTLRAGLPQRAVPLKQRRQWSW